MEITSAIDNNDLKTLQDLLQKKTHWNSSHIKKIILEGRIDVLEIFFDHEWDINKPLQLSKPPPVYLALNNPEMMEWFISHGANLNRSCDEFDLTPLSVAVANSSILTIQKLIEIAGPSSFEHGELLHNAVARTDDDAIPIVKFLLDHGGKGRLNGIQYENFPRTGVFVAQLDMIAGWGTPLHIAAAEGKLEMVEFLVNEGADPLKPNTKGIRPSKRARTDEIRAFLLSYEFDRLSHFE